MSASYTNKKRSNNKLSKEEFEELLHQKPSKYRSTRTTVNEITFQSKYEAERYLELKQALKNGKIRELTLQPKFKLHDEFMLNGKKYRAIHYVGDFMYKIGNKKIVEDTKGFKPESYKIKKKMFLKRYGTKYEFLET